MGFAESLAQNESRNAIVKLERGHLEPAFLSREASKKSSRFPLYPYLTEALRRIFAYAECVLRAADQRSD
jgi:hypothetical protein